MKGKRNISKTFVIAILTMLFSIALSGQDKVLISRDSLYNLALNVAELKIDNAYLLKKVTNQRLVIQSMGVVISETEMQVDVLTKMVKVVDKSGFWKTTWIWLKGVIVGAVTATGVILILNM